MFKLTKLLNKWKFQNILCYECKSLWVLFEQIYGFNKNHLLYQV